MRISDWSSDVCSSDLDYTRRYTGMPFLVRLEKRRDAFVAGRFLRASDFAEGLGQTNNPDWKTVALDESSGDVVAPNGSIGFRWGEDRSEEHTYELQSQMRISDAVSGLQKNTSAEVCRKAQIIRD